MTDEKSTLEATVALLEATLEATPDAIVVFDSERRVIRYNRAFLETFGFTADDLHRGDSATIAEGIAVNVEPLTPTAQDWDEPASGARVRLRVKDGRVFERWVTPIAIGGQVAGRVVTYRDITDQDALEHANALLEKAQEVAHIGSWVAELDGSGGLLWSAETYRIFGLTTAEFSNTHEAFSLLVHPDDLAAVRRASEDAVASGSRYAIEHRILRGDGEVRWVLEKGDVVRGPERGALRLVGTVQDVTDRRRLEEQLRSAQRLEAIGRLAGGVAHDLNNALTAIAGYTELAIGVLDEQHPARPDVQEIRRAAERAESVTRQLLAFSRKQPLAPRVFSLNESIVNIGRLLQRVLGENVHLTTTVDPDLPPICGDAGQIEQAILNLAVNARDAMPDGGRLLIRTALVVADETFARSHQPITPGPYVELRVADTGHGMTPEVLAHVFEPFFTTKGVGKGTGLGLAMVYGTIQQSGGLIFVDTEVGQGTTFRVYFPPAAAPHEPSGATAAKQPGVPTLLVVDDEQQVRNLVVRALERDGYHLLHAASAREAIDLAAAHRGSIDLLLTDGMMPEMGGAELATILVRERPDLRVAIMSGYTADDVMRAGGVEPVLFLRKPFTPGELRQRIRDVLAPTTR